jgi:hypothetical protein
LLTPNSTGYVSGDKAGVIGSWYVYGDGFGADGTAATGDCVSKGMFTASECSTVTSPTPGAGSFPPSASGAMCLKGNAAQVINGPAGGPSPAMPDYSDIFGIGIGLDFNNPGGDAGVAGFYDASKYTGISFDIDNAQTNFRVQFPTSETLTSGDSAYWGGAAASGSPVMAGTNTFTWAEVGGPMYEKMPPAFDNTMIQAIQFSVYTDVTAAVPVSFCISNLTLTQ